jgi:hypothetical protein
MTGRTLERTFLLTCGADGTGVPQCSEKNRVKLGRHALALALCDATNAAEAPEPVECMQRNETRRGRKGSVSKRVVLQGDDGYVAGSLGQSPSPLGTAVVEERERDIARAPPAERRLKKRMGGARAVSARRLAGTVA